MREGGGEVKAEKGEGGEGLHWRTDLKEAQAGRGERRRKEEVAAKKEEGGGEGKKEKVEENVSSVERRVTLPGSANRREV